MAPLILFIQQNQVVSLKEIPLLSFDDFHGNLLSDVHSGSGRVAAFFGKPANDSLQLFAVLAYDQESRLGVISTVVKKQFPSLTKEIPQVHLFEREIAEQWDVKPMGHPWLKPVRFHASYLNNNANFSVFPSVTDFFQISGKEIHEVAVGPVHAGIIEPGHFRFQCHGEQVFHLEISLGYQHRGVERAVAGGPDKRTIHYMETLAGDTTIGHSLAYCQAMEGLMDCDVSLRSQALRDIMLELERLANHTGDLGALANDVGFLPTASYCGRLRGDFLNMTALVCGNRFGRSMVRPGGVNFDLDQELIGELTGRLDKTFKDVKNAVCLLWDSAAVVERFEGTGKLSEKTVKELGIVGVVSRGCGVERDVRFDFPCGMFRFAQIPVSSYPSGDVFSRAFVRWLEIQRSVEFISDRLGNLPQGPVYRPAGELAAESLTVSLVEGFRGEICHVALTDKTGKLAHYKIVDPSFHNWQGLAMVLRNEEISNFPLCNKSFNLSYCGHDL